MQKQFASTTLNTKIKKGLGLRKRVSKFFTGPHNASLEPGRIINQFAPPASSPKYVLLKLSDHTHRPALLEEQPHASCLPHVQPIYEDGSSIADCPTPEKSPDERHESCSGKAPAKPSHRNMQPPKPAQHGPFLTQPTDDAYARIAGSLPSEMKMSDQAIFDSRHGGGPIRGLYRHSQTHHEHLMHDRLAKPPSEQAYDTVALDSGNDWLTSPANSNNSVKDLLKAIPASNIGARQLAALNPGHRGGVIISNTPLSRSVSQLTAMDTDNASREWYLQPSGSVADANAEFHAVDVNDGVKRFRFSFSDPINVSSDLREANMPRAAAQAGRGHDIRHTVRHRPSQSFPARSTDLKPNLHTSIVSSDAFDHTLHAYVRARHMQPQKHVRARANITTGTTPKTTRSRSPNPDLPRNLVLPLPQIPTGSDILRAAAADPHADQTPIVFRTYLSDVPFPDDPPSHPAHGRMVSTSQPPLPLPLPKYVGEGEYDYEYAGEPGGKVNDGGEDETAFWEDVDENEATPLATKATTPPPPTTLPSAIPDHTNATIRILHLVRGLEDQRDELIGQNHALLAAVEHARVLLRGAEAAYDAAQGENKKKIGELERKNRELREENRMLRAEAGGGDGELERSRSGCGEGLGLGEFFRGARKA